MSSSTPRSQSIPVTAKGVSLTLQASTDVADDWNQTVIITDPSLHKPGREREDFAVTVFRKTGAELGGFEVGAPVLFRCLKVCRERTQALTFAD